MESFAGFVLPPSSIAPTDCGRVAARDTWPPCLDRSTIEPSRDDYPERYVADLAWAAERDLAALRHVLAAWRYLAPDAADAAAALSDAAFRRLVRDIRRERAGLVTSKPLREEWIAIRLPTPMFVITVVAARLRVSFGTAFHRMFRDGMLLERACAVQPTPGALRDVLGPLAPMHAGHRALRAGGSD